MAGVIEELMVKIGANTKSAEKKIGKFEGFVDDHMDKIVGAGAAAGAGFTVAFTDALEQGASSDLIAAQLDLTETESERAGDVAGELFAGAYGENIGEVNEALRGIIAQTGELGDLTDSELSDMGANALDLAKILDTDVTRVVQVAGQAVEEDLAGSMGEAFDQITAASQDTMPGLQDEVLDATSEYAQFFRTIGLDGERAFGLLASASEGGQFEIDKTGDAIKEFTIRSTDMSTASVDAFDAIGLDAQEMSNKILAGGDTAAEGFDQIVSGLLGIEDPTERANAAIALFGTPIEDMSVQDIPDFLEGLTETESGLGDVSGAADDAGDVLNDNAAQGFTDLGRTVKQDLIAEMEPLIPLVKDLADLIIPLAPALMVIAGAVLAFVAALKTWRAIAVVATVVQWAWNAALFANPVTWIILAIVALIAIVVLLIVHWEDVVAFLKFAWAKIKSDATKLKDWVVDAFWSIVDGLSSAVTSAKDWAVGKFNEIVAFVSGLPGRISNAASGMWDGIKSAFKGAVNWLIGAWNGLSFTIPSVDMGPLGEFGGFTLSTPNIPMLAEGGIVTGPTLLMAGEGVHDEAIVPLPRGMRDGLGGDDGGTTVTLRLEGDLLRVLREDIAASGGNVQTVLGQE